MSAQKIRAAVHYKRKVVPAMYIHNNLNAALHRLRKANKTVILWVDAICINQRDNTEKSVQLLRMPEVYRKARWVRVWLGESDTVSDTGMAFVSELLLDQENEDIITVNEEKQKVMAFISLLRRPWFGRRWIIQEIFFAKQAAVHCGGGRPIDWKAFMIATERFMRRLPQISDHAREKDIYDLRPEILDALEIYGANCLRSLDSSVLGKNETPPVRLQTMDYLVPRLIAFDSGDPRDTIFSVFSLARRTVISFPLPDYSKSVLDVFAGFVKYYIEYTRSLDIICRPWAPEHTFLRLDLNAQDKYRVVNSTLPSWIPQLDKSTFGTPESIFRGRKNGDSLTGRTSPIYEASKGGDLNADFGTLEEPTIIYSVPLSPHETGSRPEDSRNQYNSTPINEDASRNPNPERTRSAIQPPRALLLETYDGTLKVKGLLLGGVQEVSMRMIPEIVPKEVITMAGWKFSQSDESHRLQDVPDELWKSLVANKDKDGKDIAGDAQYHCLEALQKGDRSGDIRVGDLIRRKETSTGLKAYLERVRNVCWNRQAFLAGPNKKIFGLGPEKMLTGDLICIIYGCSVPVVLRRTNHMPRLGQKLRPPLPSQSSGVTNIREHASETPEDRRAGEYYQIIGECYVDRHMDGQAIGNSAYAENERYFTLV
jgi:hypothetical protein